MKPAMRLMGIPSQMLQKFLKQFLDHFGAAHATAVPAQ